MRFFPTTILSLSLRLSLFILPVLSFGQQTINGTILHDGIQREYILYVPAIYTQGLPFP